MPSEIKENVIDTSDEVTHLEFVGDGALASSENITLLEKFLESALKASCKLELLCIGGLKQYKPISDRTIIAIAHSCPNLYHLSLKGCHNITDNSVNILLQQIHNLKFLELDQCRFITDSSICNIANSCPKLEHLDIGVCDASDASICNIAHSCKNLKYLNIRCCCLVTNIAIHEIAQHCSNLEFLSIDLWSTYANLEDIVQYCEDKIKDEHYQKSIVELEQDMRGTAERLSLMVRMYGLNEKINYQPTNPEYDTNYAITEFVPRDIKYRGKESLSSHMKFQTP
nr:3719_t:CDS:2 [Entrophospora candida]